MVKVMFRFVSVLALSVWAASASAAFITFDSSGTFVVPVGVTSVNVIAIGGGGGGANGHQGGGGSGYVDAGTFAVTPGSSISVIVGAGGSGALEHPVNDIIGLTPGGASSFGGFLSVGGGLVVTGVNETGNDGGSGGGASWNGGAPFGTPGCTGGAGGSDGDSCRYAGGLGQGDYTSLFALFVDNVLSAGAGGAGGTGTGFWNGGGGAGGLLISGLGPNAGNGAESWSAMGGVGYGAGGGAGGYDGNVNPNRIAGGDGADGLVYIEYTASVPAPAPIAMLALAMLGLGMTRRRTS